MKLTGNESAYPNHPNTFANTDNHGIPILLELASRNMAGLVTRLQSTIDLETLADASLDAAQALIDRYNERQKP